MTKKDTLDFLVLVCFEVVVATILGSLYYMDTNPNILTVAATFDAYFIAAMFIVGMVFLVVDRILIPGKGWSDFGLIIGSSFFAYYCREDIQTIGSKIWENYQTLAALENALTTFLIAACITLTLIVFMLFVGSRNNQVEMR